MGAMHFEQVQRFILANKCFGLRDTLGKCHLDLIFYHTSVMAGALPEYSENV